MAKRLGELLIEEGRLTAAQLEEALRSQRVFGGSLGTHLLRLGLITEPLLGAALERIHGVPAASRAELVSAPPEVVALLPSDYARRHRAIPFRVDGDDLHLALQNPADTLAVHEAAFLTGFSVVAHVAPETVIRDALAQHLRLDPGPSRRDRAVAPGGPAFPPAELTTGPLPAGSPPPRPAPRPAIGEKDVTTAPQRPVDPPAATGTPLRTRSLADVGRALADAKERDDVLAIALEDVAQFFPRACVFAVRGNEAVLWRSTGLPRQPSRALAIPIDETSVLAPSDDGPAIKYGPVAATPSNQDLYTLLGGKIPRVAMVIPVLVKGRPVLMLYGDDPTGSALPPDFGRMRRLSALLSWALEAVILRAKIYKESRG